MSEKKRKGVVEQRVIMSIINASHTKLDIIGFYSRPKGSPDAPAVLEDVHLRRWSYRPNAYGKNASLIENVRIPLEKLGEVTDHFYNLMQEYTKSVRGSAPVESTRGGDEEQTSRAA
jgi:hypothetical protein